MKDEAKSAPIVVRKRRLGHYGLQQMFDALNAFLDREGDRHFNPDVFDSIHDQWQTTGRLEAWQIDEVKKLYKEWVSQ